MDRDVFSRCTRLGRQVADGVIDGIEGRPWSSFQSAKLVDELIQQAGGIPVAKSVFDLTEKYRVTPVLPGFFGDSAHRELDQILRELGTGALDSLLVDVAKRFLPDRPNPLDLAIEFLFTVITRHAFEGRGGSILESRGAIWYNAHLPEIRQLLQPVVERAARLLVVRPDARVLGVSHSEKISPDEDLRGDLSP